jgi:hypothetical protein
MFLLVITKVVEPRHQDVFTHRDRLTKLQKSLKQLSSEDVPYTTNPKPILLEAHVMSLLNTDPATLP